MLHKRGSRPEGAERAGKGEGLSLHDACAVCIAAACTHCFGMDLLAMAMRHCCGIVSTPPPPGGAGGRAVPSRGISHGHSHSCTPQQQRRLRSRGVASSCQVTSGQLLHAVSSLLLAAPALGRRLLLEESRGGGAGWTAHALLPPRQQPPLLPLLLLVVVLLLLLLGTLMRRRTGRGGEGGGGWCGNTTAI